jgi:hypothetical protein
MDVEHLREFHQRAGFTTIKSENYFWMEMGPKFYQAMPPSGVIDPTPEEVEELFKNHAIWGLKYSTKRSDIGKEGYLYCCYDKSYNFSNVGRRTRNYLRKVLKNFRVERVSFDYLKKQGLPLNIDSLKRRNQNNPIFSDPKQWAQFCQAGKETPGAEVWGAMVEGKLAGYSVSFQVNQVYELLYLMSRTDMRSYSPNYALHYISISEVLNNRPEISCVCWGTKSIRGLSGVDEYKLRMGFQKEPVNFVVILNPWLRPFLLNKAARMMSQGMLKLFPQHDRLRLTCGILDMARASDSVYPIYS